MRFKKLEELRAREWAEDVPLARARANKPAAKPKAKPQAKPSGGPSRLRDMIAAARKAKKEQESQSSDQSESEKSEPTPENKTFEAGFFRVSSPLKRTGSVPATPVNKPSLLKSVLSSEARKASASKNSTSFAMLRASMMSKNVDIEGVSPLAQTPTMTPVNLFATPARSILKQANPISSKKPEKLKMVLFEEASSPTSYTSCASEEPKEVEKEAAKEVEVKEAEKENKPSRRRSRLSRQNAEDKSSPVMTRSRRKSAQTPLFPADTNGPTDTVTTDTLATDTKTRRKDTQETPKRASRRRKSAAVV